MEAIKKYILVDKENDETLHAVSIKNRFKVGKRRSYERKLMLV